MYIGVSVVAECRAIQTTKRRVKCLGLKLLIGLLPRAGPRAWSSHTLMFKKPLLPYNGVETEEKKGESAAKRL